ncbi:MAG TPA: arylsulfatase [Acidimicrobiia bacterium]|nr:arylsulfatase [Acidimicrobiia bacterium]
MSQWSEFGGVIGRYRNESTPWWPEPLRPPDGAPNILVVLLDDVGFAQLGCFGSDIDTPTFDRLAANGLRYTNFHTTALCSPTRACVLTGRNHHRVGMGRITDLATGFPGYHSRIGKEHGFLSEMLVPLGYGAYAVGKWHLTPDDECHLGASRVRWPLSRGFERFYGFFGGETHQFAPALVADNHRVTPPRSWEDGYHLSEDLADRALEFLADLHATEPDKPFFLYLCPAACHSPHHAPPDWIERYRGRFDAGWDAWREETFARQQALGVLPPGTELSPRPEWVPAWDSLPADEQRVAARYQECFAAFLSHADHHVGRVLDFLDEIGRLDDTLVFALSDNGASSEGGKHGSINDARPWNLLGRPVSEAVARIDELGGPRVHNNYPWGWTVAGNTPFRRWKREVHEGGVADPLVVSWPAGIRARGEVRRQYVHAIDLAPTVLDLLGIDAPAEIGGVTQTSLDGVSVAATFDDPDAPNPRTTQYYEMFGCRALYHEGWKAVVYHPLFDQKLRFDDDPWELYHVDADASECHDLAAKHPDKLRDLVELWWSEAEKNRVLPLDNMPFDRIFGEDRPGHDGRRRYVYYPFAGPVTEEAAVNVRNRSHRITADVEVPDGGAEGILLAQGSILGGYAFYVLDGRLHYVHNFVGLEEHRLMSSVEVAPGRHTLEFRFDKTDEHQGRGGLLVDGETVAAGDIPRFTPTRFSITDAGLCCGYHLGMPVVDDYRSPFRFTGRLHRVIVDVDGQPFVDDAAEADLALRAQ